MRFLIPFFLLVSINANCQRTICSLEYKPRGIDSDGNWIYAICLKPQEHIGSNDWFVRKNLDYIDEFGRAHLLRTYAEVKKTTDKMDINGSFVPLYLNLLLSEAFALDIQSNNQCILTPLECEYCIDDFKQSYVLGGDGENGENVVLSINYYSKPKIDFIINATEASIKSDEIQEFQLKRCIYSTLDYKKKWNSDINESAVVWEFVGQRTSESWDGLNGQPLMEIRSESDNDATYYFLTRGYGDLTIVKITEKGKDVSIYDRRPGCGIRIQDKSLIKTKCCDQYNVKFEFKKVKK